MRYSRNNGIKTEIMYLSFPLLLCFMYISQRMMVRQCWMRILFYIVASVFLNQSCISLHQHYTSACFSPASDCIIIASVYIIFTFFCICMPALCTLTLLLSSENSWNTFKWYKWYIFFLKSALKILFRKLRAKFRKERLQRLILSMLIILV